MGEMALAYTRGKKKFAAHEDLHNRLAVRLARMRGMFEDLVADDVEAFGLYHAATQMSDGPEKDEATQLALAAAIDVPREMAKLSLATMDDLASLADKCNPYLLSDLTAAAALVATTVRLCDYNVRVNVLQLTDRQGAEDIGQASRDDVDRACRMLAQIEETAGKY